MHFYCHAKSVQETGIFCHAKTRLRNWGKLARHNQTKCKYTNEIIKCYIVLNERPYLIFELRWMTVQLQSTFILKSFQYFAIKIFSCSILSYVNDKITSIPTEACFTHVKPPETISSNKLVFIVTPTKKNSKRSILGSISNIKRMLN